MIRPMRRARLHLLTVLPAALLFTLAGGCSSDDDVPDAGTSPDTGVDAGPEDSGSPPAPFGLHYHRADGVYDGWTLEISGDGITEGSVSATEVGGFGAFYPLPEGVGNVTFTLENAGEVDTAGTLSADASGAPGLWVFSTHEQVYLQPLPAVPGEDQVVIFYLRGDDAYSGWGLHLWEDVAEETLWSFPKSNDGVDDRFGAYFVVDVAPGGDRVNLIVHMGDDKDPGPDMGFDISQIGNIAFVVTGVSEVFGVPQEIPAFAVGGAGAHWVDAETIAWETLPEATQFELRFSPTADIELDGADIVGGETVALSLVEGGLTEAQIARFPHLRSFTALSLDAAAVARIPEIVKGQLMVVARDDSGAALEATKVQIPGVLDDQFTYTGPLGAVFDMNQAASIYLWAPTAQAVKLVRFETDLQEIETLDMTEGADGVWSITGDASWYGTYYQYEVTVYHPVTDAIETTRTTDPYSVSLSMNSRHTQLVDLASDTALMPMGWDLVAKPELAAPEDIVVYEGHVRDFSIFDETVPAAHRGKYLAFTYNGVGGAAMSDGMQHLSNLAASGLSHFHILPMFDIATVNEDFSMQANLTSRFDDLCVINPAVPEDMCTQYGSMLVADVLAAQDPTTGDAQEINGYLRSFDGFNWGYDPFHYTAPEGSYATDPSDTSRIVELRQMVQSLSEVGLRVVMDVVYNHTNAAGLSDYSVLDKVVPGYYHRLNIESGFVENSTCCQNTATEHTMMERLMIDSLVTWAKFYKVDAFRFDLMGHHMKFNMENARDALHALTLADDGVDGSKIYLYGEGWDFGEVQNGARGRNATQLNMDGTGIGTFNDRIRDAVRGGSPFDSQADLRTNQGWGNGVVYDPNESPLTGDEATEELLNSADLIRVGMAGNLETFAFVSSDGRVKTGKFITYNGAFGGYTADPQEVINYVCKHDNQTLWDNNAYKMPTGTPTADRVRAHNVSLDVVALGQGIPFFQMGTDLLRSKSMQRDSYDSGDWYNRVDWTYQTNNWNVGLPREDKDGPNWPIIEALLADSTLSPDGEAIQAAVAHFQEILAVRKSSPLFRLRTAAEIETRLDYHNVGPDQIAGLIAMSLTDGTCAGADLDEDYDALFVVINANDEAQEVALMGASGFELHAIQQASADPVVRTASFDAQSQTFSVPARTSAVFVQPQGASQGAGLPCNPN